MLRMTLLLLLALNACGRVGDPQPIQTGNEAVRKLAVPRQLVPHEIDPMMPGIL